VRYGVSRRTNRLSTKTDPKLVLRGSELLRAGALAGEEESPHGWG